MTEFSFSNQNLHTYLFMEDGFSDGLARQKRIGSWVFKNQLIMQELIEHKPFLKPQIKILTYPFTTKVIVICIPLLNQEITGFGGFI